MMTEPTADDTYRAENQLKLTDDDSKYLHTFDNNGNFFN